LNRLLVLLLFSLITIQTNAKSWLDESNEILLPPELEKQIGALQNFSYLWWDFLVVENVDSSSNDAWTKLSDLCDKIKASTRDSIEIVVCNSDHADYQNVLQDWGRDFIFRTSPPSRLIAEERLNATLAKMSFANSDLLLLYRMDPFESFRELIKIKEQSMPLHFEKRDGSIYLKESRLVLIPVLFKFPPKEIEKTKAVLASFRSQKLDIEMVGPHQTFLENKEQVLSDSTNVTIVGLVLLFLFGLFFWITKRWHVLLMIPPLLIATSLSALLVVLINGSIHGITLGFGMGIIGLSFDYGFHSIFTVARRKIWISNLYGLLTTLAALLSVMISTTPLLKQMMLFASFGITISFILLFLIEWKWKQFFFISAFDSIDFFSPAKDSVKLKWSISVLSLLFLGALFTACYLPVNFSMKGFDYKSESQERLQRIIYGEMRDKILFSIKKISGDDFLSQSQAESDFAKKNGLKIENYLTYAPSQKVASENSAKWKALLTDLKNHSPQFKNYQKIFAPFVSSIQTATLSDFSKTAYLKPFVFNQELLTIWKASNDGDVQLVKNSFPNVMALHDSAKKISNSFAYDLKIIVPVALLLVLLFLYYYYRSMKFTFLALVPFMTASLFVIYSFLLLRYEVTFISFVALLMICGMSIDYGIFAVDVLNRRSDHRTRIANALMFSGISTIIGCAPMLIAKHQILFQFGLVLTVGVIGTVVGTFYVIPLLDCFFKRERHE